MVTPAAKPGRKMTTAHERGNRDRHERRFCRVRLLAACLVFAGAALTAAPGGRAAEQLADNGVMAAEDTQWSTGSYEAEKPLYDARAANYEGKYAEYDGKLSAAMSEFYEIPQAVVRFGVGAVLVDREGLAREFMASEEHERLWSQYFERQQAAFAAKAAYDQAFARLAGEVESDPEARRELWTLHLRWLKARAAERLAEATYHEVRVATIKIKVGWWNRLFETTNNNLSLVASRLWDKSADILIGNCIDDFLHKMAADLPAQTILGLTPVKLGERVADCLGDAFKDLVTEGVAASAEAHFVQTLENQGVLREVAIHIWQFYILAEAEKKPGFFEEIRDRGFKPTVEKLTTRFYKTLNKELVTRAVVEEQVRQLVSQQFRDPQASRRPIEQLVAHSLETAEPAMRARFDAEIGKAVDESIGRIEAAEFVTKTTLRIYDLYVRYSNFNLGNYLKRYFDTVSCLKEKNQGREPGAQEIIRILDSDIGEYNAFQRSCTPGAEAKFEADMAQAQDLLDRVDLSIVPHDLPARLWQIQEKIVALEQELTTMRAEQLRELVAAYGEFCRRGRSESSGLAGRLSKVRTGVAEIGDQRTIASEESEKACSIQVYPDASAAAEAARAGHAKATEAMDPLKAALAEFRGDAGGLPEPFDYAGPADAIGSLATDLDGVVAEIEEAIEEIERQRALIDEGASLAGRYFDPRARALVGKFEALRGKLSAIEIPGPDRIADARGSQSAVEQAIAEQQTAQAEAMACMDELPDLARMVEELDRLEAEAQGHVRTADERAGRAEQCVADLKTRIVARTESLIEGCDLPAAKETMNQLPPQSPEWGDLADAWQERNKGDKAAREAAEAGEKEYRAGRLDAGIANMKQALGHDSCELTKDGIRFVLEGMEVTKSAVAKAESDIEACRFEDARDALRGVELGLIYRTKLWDEAEEKERVDDEARETFESTRARFDGGRMSVNDALRNMREAKEQARCEDTRTVIGSWIDGVVAETRQLAEAARAAIASCDFPEVTRILIEMPQGSDLELRIKDEAKEAYEKEKASRSSYRSGQSSFASGNFAEALESLRKAAADSPCADTREAAETAAKTVEPYQQAEAALNACKIGEAETLIGALPADGHRDRLAGRLGFEKSAQAAYEAGRAAYRKGHYRDALAKMDEARGTAICKTTVAAIERAKQKIAQKLAEIEDFIRQADAAIAACDLQRIGALRGRAAKTIQPDVVRKRADLVRAAERCDRPAPGTAPSPGNRDVAETDKCIQRFGTGAVAYFNESLGAYRCRCDDSAGFYTHPVQKICMTRDQVIADADAYCAQEGGYPVEIRGAGDYLCCPTGSTYRPSDGMCETQTARPQPQPSAPAPSQPPPDWGQIMGGLIGALGGATQGGGIGGAGGGGGGGGPSAACQGYYDELQALARQQQQIASLAQATQSDEQGRYYANQLMANTNRMKQIYAAMTSAGCGPPGGGTGSNCHYGQDGLVHCGGN